MPIMTNQLIPGLHKTYPPQLNAFTACKQLHEFRFLLNHQSMLLAYVAQQTGNKQSTSNVVGGVLFQFLEVISLWFPPHFSLRKQLPLNKMQKISNIEVVPQVAPATARIAILRRSLSPEYQSKIFIRCKSSAVETIETIHNQTRKQFVYCYLDFNRAKLLLQRITNDDQNWEWLLHLMPNTYMLACNRMEC